ncbi:hypothetical protein [Inquilinus sp. OTU3971]|uniref:hypothetical protein n=1 Tax=Inquilinus sp. OTU3971 TaxID=3043855 RepID=UPI00313E33DC
MGEIYDRRDVISRAIDCTGYSSPEEGHQDLGGNNWWFVEVEGLWYSVKDVSPEKRERHTPYHVEVLEGLGFSVRRADDD